MNIVVVGSINMDMVINVSRIPLVGETVLGNDLNYYGGGKGANQALTSAKLGVNTSIIGKVGKDTYGEKLKEGLAKEDVDIEFIDYSSNSTGMAFINVDEKSNNNIVVYPGANYDVDIEMIKKYKDIILSSKICILQLEIPIETVEYIINLCYENDILVILNPAPAMNISKDILSKVDILVPNETELFLLAKKDFDISKLEKTMYEIKEIGMKYLIVTLGDKGGAYIIDEEIIYYDSIDVDAVDTTAAGDSFVGGLAAGIMKGMDIDKSIEYASYVSALTVTKKGAQSSLPTEDEVEKFIESRK